MFKAHQTDKDEKDDIWENFYTIRISAISAIVTLVLLSASQ